MNIFFVVVSLVFMILVVAHSFWVRWLSDDAKGWDITMRENFSLGAKVELPLLLVGFVFLILAISLP